MVHTHTHTDPYTHMLGVLEMRGPPLSSVQSGGELGISSKTPAAFPEDIIRVSNSLQTLQMLLLLQCVSVSVCTHTSILWLSSQNWGQIALRCRYFGIRRFFFADSASFYPPLSPLLLHPAPLLPLSSHLLSPSSLSLLVSFYLVPLFHPITPSIASLERPSIAVWSAGQGNGSVSLYV